MTPDENTIQELMLDVGDGHTLYVQDWGNKDAAVPILFLHGGPGAGCNDGHRGYFNPTQHRVIFFDQRGSGKSLPTGSIENNTTPDLLNDIDKLLKHFQLDTVVLCGRSWGSVLAACYAIHNPSQVSAVVTGGVMVGSEYEQVLYERTNILELFYPEIWDASGLKAADMLPLWKKVLSKDTEESKRAAYRLAEIITGQMRLDDRRKPLNYETFDPSSLRVEAHYKCNDWFLDKDHVLNNAARLSMPVWIVQGRYDTVCLPKFAYQLHTLLPNSTLLWTQAGHSGGDRENWLATKAILERL